MPEQRSAAFESPLVVASNRGPVSFQRTPDGGLTGERGSGGLVTALAGVLFESDATWLSAAMTDGDRQVAASGRAKKVHPTGRARFLEIEPGRYERYYNGVANRVLWLLHHYLFDLPTIPSFDTEFAEAWVDYREVNRSFAEALDAQRDRRPVYLIQDYHLSLTPRFLREMQPKALIAHFSHTPFCGPTYLRVLPAQVRDELLRGMLGADVVAFQAEQWAENFLLGARMLPGVRVDLRRRRIIVDGRVVLVRSYPIALDPGPLREAAQSPEVNQIRNELTEWRGDAKLLLRVDRLELSKNIARGFSAYERFLDDRPEWRGKVRFLALLPKSRSDIPEYQAYADRCREAAEAIERAYGGQGWAPVEVRTDENYPQAVAAYGLYDALLVNALFDGMNLVAMEGPLVNRQHGALILSRNAGAFARLGRHAFAVNPFDIGETSEAICSALELPQEERVRRARGLVRTVLSANPARWLAAQLRDLDAARRMTSEGTQEVEEPGGLDDEHIGRFSDFRRGLGSEHGDLAREEP